MARKVKQTQKQKQKQTVIVNIEQPKAKPRKKRAPRRKPEEVVMYREFPKVVYANRPFTIYEDRPAQSEDTRPSITKSTETPKTMPILEDLGVVGTEGKGVEILDVPSKKEQLDELITPVELPKEDSERAIARTSVEPETERIRIPRNTASNLFLPLKPVPFFGSIASKPEPPVGLMPTKPVALFGSMPTKPALSFDSITSSISSDKAALSSVNTKKLVSVFPTKSTEGYISDLTADSSFRFPEPKTFRYSDIESIGPSPYASEKSVGSGGFSGSESDTPIKFDKNVFMEQQAEFMKGARNKYMKTQTSKEPKPKTKKMVPWPEELGGGFITGTTSSGQSFSSSSIEAPTIRTIPSRFGERPRTIKPIKSKEGILYNELFAEPVNFGVSFGDLYKEPTAPTKAKKMVPWPEELGGGFLSETATEASKATKKTTTDTTTNKYKPISKMNKTELVGMYKRFTGETPPKMSRKDLYREVLSISTR